MLQLEHFDGKCYGFKDKDQLDKLLTEMYVTTDKESSKHQILRGSVRSPQEILPSQFADQWKNNAPHTTIRAKEVDCIAQRVDACNFSKAVLVGQKVSPEEMFFLKYTYRGKGMESEKKKEWFSFLNVMYDFLDYIVPIISKNEKNGIKLDMIMYADHTYPNDGIPDIEIIYRSNDKDYLWLLFQEYAKYLNECEKKKEGEKNEEKN